MKMMFKVTKNIESAFQHVRLFSIVLMLCCTVVSVFAIYRSLKLVAQTREQVYVLANGKALEVFAADRKDNIPVEARDHIKMFHFFFFTLAPDDKVIKSNITKALYLADRSAKSQYDNLLENGYYTSLISGNVSQEVEMDSLRVDIDQYPYYFRYYGRQKIVRPTSIVTRSLVTEGYLRNVIRSDYNSHGFLIEKWQIMENKDVKIENR